MPGHDLIVIGTSAGGVEALTQLVKDLPADLPAAILVVLHVPAHGTSVLPLILSRNGPLKATHARDGEPLLAGHIYIAPPDHHLLVRPEHIHLARGPRENGHRPAIDPLFRTAARTYGNRVIGVVLSGVLDDGTAGLLAIKRRGGIAVAQDPDDAMYPGMPRSAMENVDCDHIVPLKDLAPLLVRLAHEPVVESANQPIPEDMEREADMAELEPDVLHGDDKYGVPSVWACPDCGGTLWELHEGDIIRFRCRVGHAFSAETLLAEQSDQLEDAFWVALRALEESAALSRRLSERARSRGNDRTAERFEDQAQAAIERADIVRKVLLNGSLDTRDATMNLDGTAPSGSGFSTGGHPHDM